MTEKEIICGCCQHKVLAKLHSDGKIYVWCKECRKEVELEVETDGFAKNHVSSRDGTCMSSVPSDCD